MAPTLPPPDNLAMLDAADSLKRPHVPGYEVIEQLGQGGMGVVYKARQTKLNRLVALKVLPEQSVGDPAFAERFNREARALASLNHPNIVMIHDFGEADGQSYFVMEYVDGSNLRQRLRAGVPGLQEILNIVDQICDALQYAHDEGIVHRDIKPENILLDKKLRVKIADFGIAKLLARPTKDHTLTGPWQVMGTLHYMAPEQMDNPLAVDHRADIYSLGVILYEMLTGDLPLGRFALPSQKLPLDARLDEVLLRALAREPDRRYQQVREFQAALHSIVHPEPSRPLDSTTALTEPESQPDASGTGPPPRLIAVWILAALVVVLWPIGLALVLPATICTWLVLRRPDGKAVFRSRIGQLELALRRYLAPVFATTTGWTIIVCCLGAVVTFQPLLPLARLQVLNFAGFGTSIAQIFGYESFPAYAGAVFLVLGLILLATSVIKPVPPWHPFLTGVAGISVVVIMAEAISLNRMEAVLAKPTNANPQSGKYSFLVMGNSVIVDYTVPRGEFTVSGKTTTVILPGGKGLPHELTSVAIGFTTYAIIIFAVALVLIGTVQMRGVLARRLAGSGRH
jgi:tRNA A-37 threonylcarbamoyl transferase component Bud32